ncbi:MAG: iron-siderophore ABC transporter substrate-binding protein, partial [Mycobacterium sp.]
MLRGVRRAVTAAAAAAMAAVLCSGCTSGPSGRSGSPSASVITSTTQVAGAGVLGNQRRPDESCAPQPAGPDAG